MSLEGSILRSTRSKGRPFGAVLCLLAGFCLAPAALRAETPEEVFQKVWRSAKENVYPQEKERRFFTTDQYEELRTRAAAAPSLDDLATILNPFLNTLKVSHTGFYTRSDIEFYYLSSLFQTRQIDAPAFPHIGAQFSFQEGRCYVRAVLEGYPAERAGLRRGDAILEADGTPFHPVRSFRGRSDRVTLTLARGETWLQAKVQPIEESFHLSLLNAMRSSVRITETSGRRVGYVHLWCGTHERILDAFRSAVAGPLKDTDGLILDLRDGFGGAWYEYLDPFFRDREGFFVSTRIDRLGHETVDVAEAVPRHSCYSRPLLVLVNEGTRSGKEALAYQFKKSGRAALVGETTAGAFVMGAPALLDKGAGYLLFLGIEEVRLDGQVIEGRGIDPDIRVPYSWTTPSAEDPQLREAISEISRLLRAASRPVPSTPPSDEQVPGRPTAGEESGSRRS